MTCDEALKNQCITCISVDYFYVVSDRVIICKADGH